MRPFVAVKSWLDIQCSRSLKREALMFEKIAMPAAPLLTFFSKDGPPESAINLANELEWLRANDIIFVPKLVRPNPHFKEDSDFARMGSDLDKSPNKLGEGEFSLDDPKAEDEIARVLYASNLSTRYVAIQLREMYQMDAYPVFSEFSYHAPQVENYKGRCSPVSC